MSGSFHEGSIEWCIVSAGMQCSCSTSCSLVYSVLKSCLSRWDSRDLDMLLNGEMLFKAQEKPCFLSVLDIPQRFPVGKAESLVEYQVNCFGSIMSSKCYIDFANDLSSNLSASTGIFYCRFMFGNNQIGSMVPVLVIINGDIMYKECKAYFLSAPDLQKFKVEKVDCPVEFQFNCFGFIVSLDFHGGLTHDCAAILPGVLELYSLLQVSFWEYLVVKALFIYLILTIKIHMEDMYWMVILYCYDLKIC